MIFYTRLVWTKLKWWKEAGYQMNIVKEYLAINVFFLTLFLEIWPMRFCVYFLYMCKALLCVTCPCNIDLLLRKQQKYFYMLCIPCAWKSFWYSLMIWGYTLSLPPSSKPKPFYWKYMQSWCEYMKEVGLIY